MEDEIKKEVSLGNLPIHLNSIVKKEKKPTFIKVKSSKKFFTTSLLLYPLYKNVL